MAMTIIESTLTNDKKEKTVVYAFTASGEPFKAYYYGGKQTRLEITHNESPLGTVNKLNDKSEYTVDAEGGAVKITAWLVKNSPLDFTGRAAKVGIEANGKPIQHTAADPETHIKNGLGGLYLLMLILGIKSAVLLFILGMEGLTDASLYLIPLLIVTIAAIKYKSWTKFSIIAGLVLACLETLDYTAGIIIGIGASEGKTNSVVGMFIWIYLRLAAIASLLNALKWKLKAARRE
jgi:hypothetical protein